MSFADLKAYFDPLGPVWSALGVLVFGAIVWLLSHRSAQPGTIVSVLWGLTSYTRKEAAISSNDQPARLAPQEMNAIGAFSEALFHKNSSLELVFDRSRVNEDVYLLVSDVWIKRFQYFLNHSSPVLRRALIGAVAGKRTILQLETISHHDSALPVGVIAKLGNASFIVILRDDMKVAIGTVARGQEITLDVKFSGREDILFEDGFLLTDLEHP